MIIDLITILASSDQLDKFTFLFMPIFEMIIKLGIIGASIYNHWKDKQDSA